MICAISTVKNPKDSVRPISLPKKMNNSIKEIPVTISAFIMGISVMDIIIFCVIFLRSAIIPTAAAVPKTVEITAESIATIMVCYKAVSIVELVARLKYHSVEMPVKTHTLLELLKENAIITSTGA